MNCLLASADHRMPAY